MYNGSDQLNFTLSLDNYIADNLEALAPHKSVFDLNAPRHVSQNLAIPKTVIASMSNFLSLVDHYPDPIKLERMRELFVN